MAAKTTLLLLTVACAILLFVQLSNAQRRRGPQGFLFPEEDNRRPGVWPGGRPTMATTTTTPRPGNGGNNGCSCPSTPEYNPVCGTNGVSYSNPGKLNCAVRCGQTVSILHYGNCTPADPNAPSSTSTTTPSTTTPRRRG